MQEDESEKLHRDLWKGQADEPLKMLSTQELCARAQFLEREGAWLYRGVIASTLLIVPAYFYRLITVHNPWQIFALGLILAAWCRFVWEFRKGPQQKNVSEPCVSFVRRTLEGKRKGALLVRRGILLVAVAMFSAWLGHGPVDGARERGVTSEGVLKILAGPGYLLLVPPILGFCWFAFWHIGRKVEKAIAKLSQET